MNHPATPSSKTATGSQTSCATVLPTTWRVWSGITTAARADPATPTHANHCGTMRPRSSNQQKIVLPTAKNVAETKKVSANRKAASVCVEVGSGALEPAAVTIDRSASDPANPEPPVTPSAT